MTSLLAIDPGINTGWSYFYDGILHEVGLCNIEAWTPPPASILVIEIPQVYSAGLLKGDPNDLIAVAVMAGMLIERMRAKRTIRVRPHQWKGSMPKDVHHARLMKEASKGDLTILQKVIDALPKSKRHNVLDAYGLGKWVLEQGVKS